MVRAVLRETVEKIKDFLYDKIDTLVCHPPAIPRRGLRKMDGWLLLENEMFLRVASTCRSLAETQKE